MKDSSKKVPKTYYLKPTTENGQRTTENTKESSFAQLHRSVPANAIACLLQSQTSINEKIHSSELDGFLNLQPQCNCAWCGVVGSSFAQLLNSVPANANPLSSDEDRRL